MRLMEWNIHGMGGTNYERIPVQIIIDEVKEISPDVIVLLEFIKERDGWRELNDSLDKLEYEIHTTEYVPKRNGVLLAIRKKWRSEKVKEDIEFLEIKMGSAENSITIIGTRILTQGKYKKFLERKKLFDSLLSRLPKTHFIMLYDANNGMIFSEKDKNYAYDGERKDYNYQYIWRQVEDRGWCLITPDKGGSYNHGKYSFITGKHEPENYHTKEDHIISSFPEKNFKNADYIWDFVNYKNGYGNRTQTDVISDLNGLPDHGILVADLDLDENLQ